MSNSPLVVHTNLSPNRTAPRNHVIDTITIHCVVGQCTAETLGNIFAPASREASSNYGVDKDGRVGLYVDEANRSWCSSSSANDNRAITIEVASDTTHPYKVTDKALAGLIDLCADICKRNNIKKLLWTENKADIGNITVQNMTVHRWFANKACPGDYLYNLHGKIADEVNTRLGVETPAPAPTPTTPPTPPPATPAAFNVGDTVNFTGNTHYTSAGAISGVPCKGGTAAITGTSKGSKHPYHLIAVKGSGSTVYGWVDADSVQSTAPAKTPEETTIDNALADGIITDRTHWLGVLTGTITPNKGNIKTLMDNAHNKISK